MRAQEFLTERWTKRTVDNYFDNKKQPTPSRRDFSGARPIDGCILLKFKTIPIFNGSILLFAGIFNLKKISFLIKSF